VEFSLGKHIPNSSESFKLDRQETGATEVHMSSLDPGWAVSCIHSKSWADCWLIERCASPVGGGESGACNIMVNGLEWASPKRVGHTPKFLSDWSGHAPDCLAD
jgi:hypothetical protein